MGTLCKNVKFFRHYIIISLFINIVNPKEVIIYIKARENAYDKHAILNLLNTEIYGKIIDNKDGYKILGFLEKEVDVQEETFELVMSMDEKSQKILYKQLERKYGKADSEYDEAYEHTAHG